MKIKKKQYFFTYTLIPSHKVCSVSIKIYIVSVVNRRKCKKKVRFTTDTPLRTINNKFVEKSTKIDDKKD